MNLDLTSLPDNQSISKEQAFLLLRQQEEKYQIEQMLMQVASERAKKLYQERGECDFSFQAGEVARFRVNAYRQRAKLCLAMRYISTVIPTLQDLRLPAATLKHCLLREMPKLTTYLGHSAIGHTYWYIEAVPELLRLAEPRPTRLH